MLLNFVKTFLGLVFPLITFPYVTRVLGPEGVGRVNYSQSIIGYFAILSSFGIGTYAIREVAKVRDNRYLASKLSLELLSINLITTLIAYFVFFLVIEIPVFEDYRSLLYLFSVSLVLTTLGMDWLYVANEDYIYITIRTVALQVVSLFLLFVLVKSKDDVFNYALLIVLTQSGANIFNFYHSRKYIDFSTIKKIQVVKHLRPICFFFITALTVTLNTLIDQSMLGFIKGDYDVGLYAASIKISHIVITVMCSVIGILFPRLSYMIGNNDSAWIQLLDKTIDLLLLLSIPCTIGLTVLREPAISVLAGSQFNKATSILAIMNIMIVLLSLSHLFGNLVFMALGKEKWTFQVTAYGVVINIVLNYFLIPIWGAEGAAIATVSTGVFVLMFQFVLVKSFLNVWMIIRRVLVYGINAFIMGFVIFIGMSYVHNSFLQLSFLIPLGMIIYSVLLLVERNKLAVEVVQLFKEKVKL